MNCFKAEIWNMQNMFVFFYDVNKDLLPADEFQQ